MRMYTRVELMWYKHLRIVIINSYFYATLLHVQLNSLSLSL